MRSRFDEQLSSLNEELIIMGALCEKAIGLAQEALFTGDLALAEQVSNISAQVSKREKDIEHQQTPYAYKSVACQRHLR